MTDRLAGIEAKLAALTGEVRLVQAMSGVTIALVAGVLWRLLSH